MSVCILNVCNSTFWAPNTLIKGHNVPWFRCPNPRVQTLRKDDSLRDGVDGGLVVSFSIPCLLSSQIPGRI